MKNTWQLQEAKNQLNLVVESALKRGPQTIIRHGKPAVSVVSAVDFSRSTARKKNILELFEPLRGLNLEIERDKRPSRKVELRVGLWIRMSFRNSAEGFLTRSAGLKNGWNGRLAHAAD